MVFYRGAKQIPAMAYFSKGALFGSVHLVLDTCLHMVMGENRFLRFREIFVGQGGDTIV